MMRVHAVINHTRYLEFHLEASAARPCMLRRNLLTNCGVAFIDDAATLRHTSRRSIVTGKLMPVPDTADGDVR